MLGFLSRASRYFDRSADKALSGHGDRPAMFAADKLRSIRSYADFCRTGTFPAYPLEIFLEISNICDLKCAMCVQFSALNVHRLDQIKSTPRGFMDQGEISENLKQALQHALLVHCFGYGEPTIHPTFRSFLDLISRYEVMIDFFTNGMHLDEEFCQFLVDRRVYQITVSFSGATKETYESIYLGGNFEKVLGGIKRLAEIKKAQGSHYPIIEVNSLGFRDHVDQFDNFVSLMADHGVDVVMLKPLQSHKTIPELYEHVSIMRPDQEGKIVKRALKIGQQRGIKVNADLYMQRAAANKRDYDRQIAEMKLHAKDAFGDSARKFGENPVEQFSTLAADLEPIRNSDKERRDPRVLSLDSPRVVARSLLKVRPLRDKVQSASPIYCMEPFKTLYISRNGAAKPCCFANPQGWYLGDAKQDDALTVWRGEGFELTRAAISEGEYPMKSCETCIKRQSGPQGHFAHHMLNNYFRWYQQNFDQNLRTLVEAQVPGILRLMNSSPSAIMAEVRKANPNGAQPGTGDKIWPFESPAVKAGRFAGTRLSYLHRDFISGSAPMLHRPSGTPAGLSADFLQLLHACAEKNFVGQGAIVDLGLPSQALEGIISGLKANPQIDAIVASFPNDRDRVVERFGLAAGANDIPNSEEFVKAYVGAASNMQWLASKPIEICLVQGGTRAGAFQRAFRQLLPYFIAGRTIVIQHDFYLQPKFYPKVLMGYLGGSFEWLGQAGLSAVFRFTKPVARDQASLDPYPALPAELCLQFHRLWENPNLPRHVQLRLDLSYAQLLSEAVGQAAGLAHLDGLGEQYRDLLKAPAGDAFAKMVARVRQQLSELAAA